ncbi:hypothetical protein [Agreia sp. COWG]|uniref:hypothetical protein n=1 Tax=Agreia sp. COWG TaxID=2773266 RepID=UPI00192576E1|nr:hypothetical protein [Agreia sp. COWG]CAD6006598.1 conserved exported protein of unknown function [Agreia sp. COWG]
MTIPLSRSFPRLAAAAAGLALAVAAALAPAAPASAEPLVSVTVEGQPTLANVASSTQPTVLSVSGSGFQSIENGFGGIYVLFGWVDPAGSWQPSSGGVTATSYRYAMDDETAPQGYQRFLAFPGSATTDAAAGGLVNADGSWSTTITTAGPTFTSVDRNNVETSVDCLSVQCGIITIGAHGVVNPANESFTPVSFRDLSAPATPTSTAAPAPAALMSPHAEPSTDPSADPSADQDATTLVLPIGLGAVGLLAAAVAAVVIVRRARRTAR